MHIGLHHGVSSDAHMAISQGDGTLKVAINVDRLRSAELTFNHQRFADIGAAIAGQPLLGSWCDISGDRRGLGFWRLRWMTGRTRRTPHLNGSSGLSYELVLTGQHRFE